jgi:SAM-dependent methyltransferase
MSNRIVDTNTDSAWEEWGSRDPYFGVLTHPRFRRAAMTEQDRNAFFESGSLHVQYVMKIIHDHLDSNFRPRAILDFGCGVGRTLVSLAKLADEAVGADVSTSMLQEAGHNCNAHGLSNVSFIKSDDTLSSLIQPFDLIHSSIVFQHIPVARGKLIFRRLLARLAPRGVGAFQFLYSKSQYADTFGIAPEPRPARWREQRSAAPVESDPEMQMNPYNMNEILFSIQSAGAQKLYADFTDHGGELGLFIFFQKS